MATKEKNKLGELLYVNNLHEFYDLYCNVYVNFYKQN